MLGDGQTRPPKPAPEGRVLPGWLFGIRARIFLAVVLSSAVLLAATALLIEHQARQELEKELALRLQGVGSAAIQLLGPGLAPALIRLGPGLDSSPFYRDRRQALLQLREQTGVRRIFVADSTGRSFVDTDPRVAVGAPLTQLRTDRMEMRTVLTGRAAAAPLFTDESGVDRKSAYVPWRQGETVIALVGVEADATFLRAVRALRFRVVAIGAVGIGLAFLVAVAVARGLTRPIRLLVDWARSFGAGNLSAPVPARGRDEIAFLGTTLEQMRIDLEARDREQRAMVAGVAHEIRNPLGGLRLSAELLESEGNESASNRARLARMLREIDRLGAIVEEFLLFARPAAPEPCEVDVKEVIDELIEWVLPTVAPRGVRFEVPAAATGEKRAAWCDPNHLRQILRNLMQNAVDASPDGGTVFLRMERDEARVRIVVEDEGPGIPASAHDRLFEPFYTTKPTGAGLGLPIVRRLARANGGTVDLASGVARGACFIVSLPSARAVGRERGGEG